VIDHTESNVIQQIYDGVKEDFEILEKTYIASFFHPHKDAIWSPIKQLAINPKMYTDLGQEPQVNLLLYGPPGTGKSNFAYRVARTLNRHIVSLDMSSSSKVDLYQIMTKPHFNGTYHLPSDVVFVLDEFDTTVSALFERQKQLNTIKEELFKYQTSDKSETSDKSKTDEQMSKRKQYLLDMRSSLDGQLVLRDLLELLQGATPRSGCIIIATTNKYKEIKEMCPELFRPGRLTPTYFGYFDYKMIQEVSQYYFQKELEIPSKEVSLCPAEVMLKVIDAKSDVKKGFLHFNQTINELVMRSPVEFHS
jgi:uridine kinase